MAEVFEGDSFRSKVRQALVELIKDEYDHELNREISGAAVGSWYDIPSVFKGHILAHVESGNVQVPKSQVIGFSTAEIPVGAITMYGADTAPTGWILCDGSAVSRSDQALLFAAIGTTYGVGDGSSTFNVPDLQQRFPLGKASSGTGDDLGDTGGSIDHVHTGPSHTHSMQAHSHSLQSHTHTDPNPNASTAQFDRNLDGTTGNAVVSTLTGGQTGAPSVVSTGAPSVADTGSGGTGNTGSANPPFLVVNYIIKAV